MKPTDVAFAKEGTRRVFFGYGVIDSGYLFGDERARFERLRRVNWLMTDNWRFAKADRVGMKTLACTTQSKTLP